MNIPVAKKVGQSIKSLQISTSYWTSKKDNDFKSRLF